MVRFAAAERKVDSSRPVAVGGHKELKQIPGRARELHSTGVAPKTQAGVDAVCDRVVQRLKRMGRAPSHQAHRPVEEHIQPLTVPCEQLGYAQNHRYTMASRDQEDRQAGLDSEKTSSSAQQIHVICQCQPQEAPASFAGSVQIRQQPKHQETKEDIPMTAREALLALSGGMDGKGSSSTASSTPLAPVTPAGCPKTVQNCLGSREERRLLLQLESCQGQLAALREEVEARKELDRARERAMERLTIHAAEQEQAAAALRESGARLQEELQEADQYMLRTRLLADHSCCLAAAWKKLLSEHGIDVAAVEEPHGEDMADMDAALLQTTLKSQLVGLDKCMLVLQHSRNIHQAMGGEMQQLRERVGALGAAREAAEARECQLQQAAAMLETKLRDLTAASREREEAVRIKAEDGILERKVTEMMDAHTAALKTFEKALAATDAAATQQAKAHQAVHKLETQLQDERNSAWAREAALQAALDDTKRSFAELQKVQEESLSRMQQLELEVQSLRGRLSKAKSEGLQQEAALKLRIQGLEDEIKRRVQTSAEDMHAEQRRSSEAREALNELTREIDGMANSLEAEKARAGSLSAALSTTRDMVQNLKAEASEKDEEIDRLARRAAAADEEASRLSRSLSTAKEEAQRDAQQIAAELESAREVADQMSSRITALEQELRHFHEDSKALHGAEEKSRQMAQENRWLRERLELKQPDSNPESQQCPWERKQGLKDSCWSLTRGKTGNRWGNHGPPQQDMQVPPGSGDHAMQWAPDTQDIGSVDVSLPRPTSRTDTLVEMTAATFTANRPGAHSLGPSLPPPKKDQVLQNAELDSLVQEVKRLQQRLAAKHPVH